MKCFYHSADLDGHCSGAIVKMKHPNCEMIGINYGHEFPWDIIRKGEFVFMVDFCLQPEKQMLELAKKSRLIWIDHHKSSIEQLKCSGKRLSGIQDVTRAGCELTWEFCYPESHMPTFVKLLGRYDVWDHSDPRTLGFQYGMRQHEKYTAGRTGILAFSL